jgi:hypothetical protein
MTEQEYKTELESIEKESLKKTKELQVKFAKSNIDKLLIGSIFREKNVFYVVDKWGVYTYCKMPEIQYICAQLTKNKERRKDGAYVYRSHKSILESIAQEP